MMPKSERATRYTEQNGAENGAVFYVDMDSADSFIKFYDKNARWGAASEKLRKSLDSLNNIASDLISRKEEEIQTDIIATGSALVEAYTDSAIAKNASKLQKKVKNRFRISRILSGPVSDFADVRYIREHLDAFLEDTQVAADAASREFAEYISPEIAGWNEESVVELYASLHIDELMPRKIADAKKNN